MKAFAIAAALLGLLGVALGALGAHGLKPLVTAERLAVWHTAVSYQMYHLAPLLFIALGQGGSRRLLAWAGRCLIAGVLVFSGSLYLLVGFDLPRLGMVTPIGGILMLAGWLLLLLAIIKQPRNTE